MMTGRAPVNRRLFWTVLPALQLVIVLNGWLQQPAVVPDMFGRSASYVTAILALIAVLAMGLVRHAPRLRRLLLATAIVVLALVLATVSVGQLAAAEDITGYNAGGLLSLAAIFMIIGMWRMTKTSRAETAPEPASEPSAEPPP